MVSSGVSPPPPQPFQATRFPPSPNFRRSHKIVEGGRNYTKMPYPVRRKNIWIHIWLWILLEIKPEQNSLKKYPKNEDLHNLARNRIAF